MMLRDPEHAQAMIHKLGDFKVPVFINGSIHGNEYPGTDAAMRLIETFAYDDSPEVQAILENVILIVNVVPEPRRSRAGHPAERQRLRHQPRLAYARPSPRRGSPSSIITEWNPMVTLDLHGFVNPMLIEPTTPPHNPNYEYDLYLKWALGEAVRDGGRAVRADRAARRRSRTGTSTRAGTTGVASTCRCTRCTTAPTATPSRRPSRAELRRRRPLGRRVGCTDFVAENSERDAPRPGRDLPPRRARIPQLPIPDELLTESSSTSTTS